MNISSTTASNATLEYIKHFYKLDFCDKKEPGIELMLNQLNYFMFDIEKLNIYTSTAYIVNTLYKTDKIYLNGNYSTVFDSLESLIKNNLHLQIKMLNIEIINWDIMEVSWHLLSNFTNLKLLYIDGCNTSFYTLTTPDITMHLPHSLEALSIVNMPYYNKPFSQHIQTSNLKVIKLMTQKFNQELENLPRTLETLIIESGTFNQSINNLPSELKHLILLCPIFTMPLDSLPHGLEYFAGLYFNCFVYPENTYKYELVNLPSSIKTILLDKIIYDKQNNILKQTYKNCKIIYYDDFDNFEFIINNLIKQGCSLNQNLKI